MTDHGFKSDPFVNTELNLDQLDAVSGGDQKQPLLATTLSNIANLMHDMQKTVANNIRA